MLREQQASNGRRAETLLKEVSPYLKAMQAEVLERLGSQQGPLSAWELSCLQARALAIKDLVDHLKQDINLGKIAEKQED